MRTVVLYELVSVDGVAEAPDTFFADWDDELDAWLQETIAGQDAVILGRRSYDEWAGYWPDSDIEPFASFINAVPKYVATSSPLDPPWSASTAIEGDLVGFVRSLKSTDGGDIGIHASIAVARALLAGGAVDEIRLVVAPVVAGSGRRLLDDLPTTRLEPVRSVTTQNGYHLVHYRVVR